MATVTVRYFAGAKAAAGVESEQLVASTLADLKAELSSRPDLRGVCMASSFLVNGAQAEADQPLPDGAEVHVLPPFAGG
ncbi:MoaD/ThiS family protein [Nocardioides sp. Kera G14]|uniref:MoaD/ThiS family protein n=1 Tax=Nocardioides sp. Kera G14 TaxID=2884264 RepID=UPI001D10EE84|nr:MoaD/ThiS family protein [Nocardioides sp. Kera G14]UDY23333.1 MoaD/ThiS family protein [Nocardioides sp. Kera G14]